MKPLCARRKLNRVYTVGRDGIAPIRLKPTTNSGFAAIRLHLDDRVQELRVWLRPEARQWILVGLAEGTAGYNQVAGNLQKPGRRGHGRRFLQGRARRFFCQGKSQRRLAADRRL